MWLWERSRSLGQNRDRRVLPVLFAGFPFARGKLLAADHGERVEGVVQKLRIFAAVVSEPAVPERVGADAVVGDAIVAVGDDVLDGLAGPQAHAAAEKLLRDDGGLIGFPVFARLAREALAY